MFNPREYLIKLPQGRKQDDQGRWVQTYADYLEVRWRVAWFRDAFPHGSITTEALRLDWEHGIAIFQATVSDGKGGLATGTGTEIRLVKEKVGGRDVTKGFEDFVEKAESRAVGRALALLGFGTQFVGDELSERRHVADAPLEHRTDMPAPQEEMPVKPGKPPRSDVDALLKLMREVHGPKTTEIMLREALSIPEGQALTDARVRLTMTWVQHDTLRATVEQHLRDELDAPPRHADASPRDDLMGADSSGDVGEDRAATGPPGALATDQQIHELKMRAGESGNEALYADIQDAVDLYQGALPLEIFESLATRLTSS